MGELKVGERAPEFTLPNANGGEEWSLDSVRGQRNVLISFHVLDFTGTAERG